MSNISFKSNTSVRAFSYNKIAPGRVAVSFGYDSPIKDIAKHCAYCGCEMLSTEDVDLLTKRLSQAKGQELHNMLLYIMYQETSSISSKPQRNLISALCGMAKKWPEKTGKELAHEIINTTGSNYQARINSIKNQELVKETLNKLEKHIPSLHSGIKNIATKLVKDHPVDYIDLLPKIIAIKAIANRKHYPLTPEFLSFVNDIETQAKELTDKKKKTKFILNCYKYTPEELLTQLVQPLRVTMEHLNARSHGGKDSTYNFLPVCGGCNADRGHKKFNEFMNERPGIQNYILKSILEIRKAIANLPDPSEALKNYVQRIIEAISIMSQGKIKFNL